MSKVIHDFWNTMASFGGTCLGGAQRPLHCGWYRRDTIDGAEVFHALTVQAVQAGDAARLVLKIDDEIQASPQVLVAMEGDSVRFILPPDESAQEVVGLIQRG